MQGAQHLKEWKIYFLSIFLFLFCFIKMITLLSHLLLGLSYGYPERTLSQRRTSIRAGLYPCIHVIPPFLTLRPLELQQTGGQHSASPSILIITEELAVKKWAFSHFAHYQDMCFRWYLQWKKSDNVPQFLEKTSQNISQYGKLKLKLRRHWIIPLQWSPEELPCPTKDKACLWVLLFVNPTSYWPTPHQGNICSN